MSKLKAQDGAVYCGPSLESGDGTMQANAAGLWLFVEAGRKWRGSGPGLMHGGQALLGGWAADATQSITRLSEEEQSARAQPTYQS